MSDQQVEIEAIMDEQELKSFADFWPHYLAEHSRAGTRLLHAAGTLTSTTLAVALIVTGRWRWLPVALITGYAAAWVGHFFVEHNRPATFKHPLWSFAADYKMVALMLTGKMKR
ncbi:MAG TPA: DUF962 domain-containing protein [Pyrinomonadaceae bacterium]|nr:DUF962 domain-containing protein [Pyrinomonadaceae bacterium]